MSNLNKHSNSNENNNHCAAYQTNVIINTNNNHDDDDNDDTSLMHNNNNNNNSVQDLSFGDFSQDELKKYLKDKKIKNKNFDFVNNSNNNNNSNKNSNNTTIKSTNDAATGSSCCSTTSKVPDNCCLNETNARTTTNQSLNNDLTRTLSTHTTTSTTTTNTNNNYTRLNCNRNDPNKIAPNNNEIHTEASNAIINQLTNDDRSCLEDKITDKYLCNNFEQSLSSSPTSTSSSASCDSNSSSSSSTVDLNDSPSQHHTHFNDSANEVKSSDHFDIEFGFDLNLTKTNQAAATTNELQQGSCSFNAPNTCGCISSNKNSSHPVLLVAALPPNQQTNSTANQDNDTTRKQSLSSESSLSSTTSSPSSPSSVSQSSSTSRRQMESETSLLKNQTSTIPSTNINNNNNNNNSNSETQRRNKKKKPPNYYQTAEYAAIIKLTDEPNTKPNDQEALAKITGDSQSESTPQTESTDASSNTPTTTTSESTGKVEVEVTLCNGNGPESSSSSSLNGLSKSEHDDHTTKSSSQESINKIETKIENEFEKKLEKVSLDEPAQKSNEQTNNGAGAAPSRGVSWSSLFKSSSAPPNNTNPTTTTTNKAMTNQKSSTTTRSKSPTPSQHQQQSTQLNGGGASLAVSASSSSSSLFNDAASHATQSSNDMLKTLGNLFKMCELKHSAPALQPRGIHNRQNWCYVNATLQALLACPPFYNLIRQIYAKIKSSNASLSNVPFIASLGRFINEFKVMVRSSTSDATSSSSSSSKFKELVIGEPFEIDYFYSLLGMLKSEIAFKSGRQEDAEEFLSFLLNRLHDEMVKCLDSINPLKQQRRQQQLNNNDADYSKLNGKASATINTNGTQHNDNNNNDDEQDEWKEVGKKNRAFVTKKPEFSQSPLSDIFCGQFRSAVSQPGVKDKESVSLEPFFTLPLDIQLDSIRTVQQALEHFVQKEEVHGFTHQDTKQEIETFKRISFEDLPPVLILYLKCFVFDKQGGIQKLLKRIDFQIDLEISRELISSTQRHKLKDKKRCYKLFAVEYHHGEGAHGGHYITDVYHPGIIGWVRYDDASVRVVNNVQVLKSDDRKLIPYLLYYRRADLI